MARSNGYFTELTYIHGYDPELNPAMLRLAYLCHWVHPNLGEAPTYWVLEAAMLLAAERVAGRELKTIAHGLADAWLEAKAKNMNTSRVIYGIAAEFDIAARMAAGAHCMRQTIG